MRLGEKLAALTNDDIVPQLDKMLDQAQVSVNHWGQRIVSIDGYDEGVAINALASRYLQAKAFYHNENPSLQERWSCHSLWDKVQKLYTVSDEALKRTCLLKYLVPLKEFISWCRVWTGDPMAIICEWDFESMKRSLFEFSPKQFQALWPNTEPQSKSWIGEKGKTLEIWHATREMVESALAKQKRT